MWLPLVGFVKIAIYNRESHGRVFLAEPKYIDNQERIQINGVAGIRWFRVLSVDARVSSLGTYGFRFEIKYTTVIPLPMYISLPALLIRESGERSDGVFVSAFVFGNNPVFTDCKTEAVIQHNKEVFLTTVSGTQMCEYNKTDREFLSYRQLENSYI